MFRLAKLGLTARSALALCTVGLLPLGIVPFLVDLNRDAMETQVLRLHAVAAKSAASRVQAALFPLRSAAVSLALNPLVQADPRSRASREMLGALLQSQPSMVGVALLNAQREEYIRARTRAGGEAAERLFANPRLAPLLFERDGADAVVRLETALPGGAGFVRVVSDARELREVTRPAELGSDALLAIASASGGLVAAADPGTALDAFPQALRNAAASGRLSGAGRYLTPGGRAVLGAYAPIADSDWFVISMQPASVAEAVANTMKDRAWIAVGVALSLVVVGSLFAYRGVVRPLQMLAVAQRRLVKQRGPAGPVNEIDDLRRTFASLERQLKDRDAVGQVFVGRYQVLHPLGTGGMGTVFKAWDPKLKRNVALKTIHLGATLASNTRGDQVRSLLNEALTVARFSHRNIVAIYDLEDFGDAAFVAMELVDGQSLERYLGEHGALPADQVVPLGVAIARGLGAAHAQRIVHRDIKPGNILLGRDGSIKIADFGIAGVLSMLAEQAEMVFGTPGYLAPEGIRGRGQTEKGDMFALGVILYECLSGAVPFEGKSPSGILKRTLDATVPSLAELGSGVSTELASLVMGLVEKDPGRRRPESADVLADALGKMAVMNDWRWNPTLAEQESFEDLPAETYSRLMQREDTHTVGREA